MDDNLSLPPLTFPATEARDSTSKRRRFQVPITDYFNAADPTSSAPAHVIPQPLPEPIQSSLLTVGMRIRKSVPEGYKTIMSKPSFFLPYSSEASNTTTAPAYTELAPFCGLHKIGGLAVQPFPRAPRCASTAFSSAQSSITLSAADQEDPFSLPSSQESNYSTTSTSSNGLYGLSLKPCHIKRGLDDIADDDEATHSDIINPRYDITGPSRPSHARGSSYPFSHTRMPDLNSLVSSPTSTPLNLNSSRRTFAQPRSRRAAAPPHANSNSPSFSNKPSFEDQENNFREWRMDIETATTDHRTFNSEDFEEAAFLRRREDIEMGM